jgi:hypothetical protein
MLSADSLNSKMGVFGWTLARYGRSVRCFATCNCSDFQKEEGIIMKKEFIRILLVISAAAILMVLPAALKAAAADKSENANPAPQIKGIAIEKFKEKFERLPIKILTMDEIMKKWPRKPGESPATEPAEKAGEKAMPGVYIDKGKYVVKESRKPIVKDGKIGDVEASGVKIAGEGGNLGGVYVTGEGSRYTLSDATIELAGDVKDMGGVTAGAAADNHGELTLKNVNITVTGNSRNTVSCTNNSILKVYNSTLIDHGAPFELVPPDDPGLKGASRYLEVQGNSRTTITMQNSKSYFYDSTIIGDGWGALSTDAGGDYVYMEATNCKVKTIKSGYGAYADLMCHDTFNKCDFDVASMAIVIAGAGDATFNDTKANCGSYFALMHCVTGSPTEIGTLNVTGGEISCKKPAVLIRSHNVDINFDGVKIASESGILIKSMVNPDPNATPTDGMKVYGVHATLKNMEAVGDIIHEDPDRIMSLDLKSTTLKGAIRDAYITLGAGSKWIATANSRVVIVGDFDATQIDAPAFTTINAIAARDGIFGLPSGGTLVLKKSSDTDGDLFGQALK